MSCFSRKTIAPLSSRPIKCSVFLPVSMPMVQATTGICLPGHGDAPRASKPRELSEPLGAGARPVHPILGHEAPSSSWADCNWFSFVGAR